MELGMLKMDTAKDEANNKKNNVNKNLRVHDDAASDSVKAQSSRFPS